MALSEIDKALLKEAREKDRAQVRAAKQHQRELDRGGLIKDQKPRRDKERIFTVREAAAEHRVSEDTMRRLIATGEIKSYRVGQQIRIRARVLAEWVARQEGGQQG